jgi:serine/threonine protein kinase
MFKKLIYKVSSKHKSLDSWIKNLPDYFADHGETIFKSRNEVKIFDFNGYLLNVKAFKVPNWINRFVYVHFRASKAERSFEYAQRFLQLGIPTPEPVGFIECHEKGLLQRSFYVSSHCFYDFTLREVLNYQTTEREEILRQWIKFTWEKLHLNGIFHLDYSPGNTLINKAGDQYAFNIIDLNRMKFMKISFEKGLKNFRQLDTDLKTIDFIAREYAILNGEDPLVAVHRLRKFHLSNVSSRHRHMKMKNSIKKFFRSGHAGE